ncbi:GNAT family N-acetyltransferase [Nakamurella leprariae]|uniref:GNAT family N-acetyltransferase n=1 Tax=Nakamurella leprariae TaxID=2803911 RepID=A0A938YJ71_9ACTN|nr:GNAT family N-acetyltransferase [Nakamurella leprariae]MBM9469282.1 GNAT family N-acetyltransferase [Nakamurella leprariae]
MPAQPRQSAHTSPVLRMLSVAAGPAGDPDVDALATYVRRRFAVLGHSVESLTVRHLPDPSAEPADHAGVSVTAALTSVAEADAVVVAAPRSADTLDRLLALDRTGVLRDKPVLLFLTGAAASDPSVREPVAARLTAAGARSVSLSAQLVTGVLSVFPDGGLLIDPDAAADVTHAISAFVGALRPDAPAAARAAERRPTRISPVAGAPDLLVEQVHVDDPRLRPLLQDLIVEYSTRYAMDNQFTDLTEVDPTDFLPPHGTFLLLSEDGEVVAGGALRRYRTDDALTAEVKRVWTASRHRRRGLSRRLMAELETAARQLGYTRIHLTTGPRQPEARALYLSTGYTPRFDVAADPATIGPLAFARELVPGAGLPFWPGAPVHDESLPPSLRPVAAS